MMSRAKTRRGRPKIGARAAKLGNGTAECRRCGYEWRTRVPYPKECPHCKGRTYILRGPDGKPRTPPPIKAVLP